MIVDQEALPAGWPTHRQSDAFWIALGRAVASFGFLEWTIKGAVLALTGDRLAPNDDVEIQEALSAWGKQLMRASTATLVPLTKAFEAAAAGHGRANIVYVAELVRDINAVADLRNAICHASWNPLTDESARPMYIAAVAGGVREPSVLETTIDVAWLNQLQRQVAELACSTINVVTTLGLPFPGSSLD